MSPIEQICVVGIGASAGGLEAISHLIKPLTNELPCAYVVLQHLSPNHRSMMVEILARETILSVREATHGERLLTGTLYVVPSNFNAHLKNGELQLLPASPEVVPKPSINQFFISMAAELGERAIGVLLSGTGSDGVAGLRAIQAAGGFTLVQSPESAKYDGMPLAALEAGAADHVMTPEGIAAHLPSLLNLPSRHHEQPPEGLFEQLLERLRQRLHVDFSGYKSGTLIRRIRRREVATGNPDLKTYLEWVGANPEELELLARDILISVTAFFRDKEAFDALARHVEEICAHKLSGREIRIWVAGCATGEEAYSIAILLAETLGDRLPQHRIQIFATDIDDEALNVARRGIYPAAALNQLPPEWLSRHFHSVNQTYEVAKHLRDMLVFARHNLVSDPPFLRLDMVSCRNVLIYFDAALQARVLQSFHFGLQKDGLLFLGRSESVTQAEQLFTPHNRRERLFRKNGESNTLPTPSAGIMSRPPAPRHDHKRDLVLHGLVEHYALGALLCDTDGQVLHSVGKLEHYLQFPIGNARLNLAEVTIPPLRGEVLTLMHRCQQSGKPQRGRKRKQGKDWLRICVSPLDDGTMSHLMVMFKPETASRLEEPPAVPDRAMEDELSATREHLQALVEEMTTTNEEMQALNEEVQASNEELQATNEELEAANEELQATNQELISLNDALNLKTRELAQLATEYAHLYDALPFPTLVFDKDCRLQRFNSMAGRHFELRANALQQPIADLECLTQHDETINLEQMLQQVLTGTEREESLLNHGGRQLRLTVTPGLDPQGQVEGLVVTLVDVSDLTQALAQLRASQMQLSALMEKTWVIFAMKSQDGNYTYANRRFLEFFDIQNDYTGKSDFQLLPPDLAAEMWAQGIEALRKRGTVSAEHSIHCPNKGKRYLKSIHQPIFDDEGKLTAILIEAQDVTENRRAEEQLRITARVFNQAGEAIVVTDPQGMIQTVNLAFTSITGYTHADAIGKRMSLLQSGRHTREFYQSMWRDLIQEGCWQGEIWNRRRNGSIYPGWLTINRIDNQQGEAEHFVAVFSDITQIKDTQHKAEYLATHDALTGLPNRALFHDHLRHALAQARRKKTRVALLFIDLDNFKTINDTLGHDVGDEILKQASGRLRGLVRDIDTVARLGGDEFTAILLDCDADGADQVSRRIVDELSASFDIAERRLFVSASIGIAFYPDDGTDSAELIKKADSAMYRAKEQGRNRVEFFKHELHLRLLKEAGLENGLREALRKRQFHLVFQPKFGLTGGRPLLGAEALLRWNDPILGSVSPSEFIPIAESRGMIVELDRMVQEMLIDQLSNWRELGLKPPSIAFNASPRSLREPEFSSVLLSRADTASLPHTLLQLEITEGALLDSSSPHVLNNLNALHQAGLRIAVDDFGTGYSSLSYLKRLPIHELKIDKSFVDGLGHDKGDEAITRAVLGLAEALDLTTIAEGIETRRQLDWLVAHGCQMGQGHYLREPIKADDFEDLIARYCTP
jgi:two-component system, chemotaxis family, CheB/CheR fusion protein